MSANTTACPREPGPAGRVGDAELVRRLLGGLAGRDQPKHLLFAGRDGIQGIT
jgi:hypothetical protein